MDKIGILDPEGININPMNNKAYSDNYRELAKIWSNFPAYQRKEDIIESFSKNQVTIITSGTGSGKTVLAPKFALHSLNYEGNVVITLPKQIITKSSAIFGAETLDVNIGEQVGYKYRGSSNASDATKLLYATDGTVVQYLLKDPQLSNFDFVIIDEAHERKIQIDFLLYLLREAIKLRPTLKIVIMSATINTDLFLSYFSDFSIAHIDVGSKTNYPIKSFFAEKTLSYKEAIKSSGNRIERLIGEDGDILLFVLSSNDAFGMCDQVHDYSKKINNAKSVFCIEVFSGMNLNKQKLAQDKDQYKLNNNYTQKLVVATNVAESSLTIDGIKYVIDTGYELKSSYDPYLRASKLDTQLITYAQAMQRKGRAGRTGPGECYHMYTEDDLNNMQKYPEPDIRKTELSGESLRLLSKETIQTVDKLLDIFNDFIEPPKKDYINDALLLLVQLGAISNNRITQRGIEMANIPFEPMESLTLLWAIKLRCKFEVLGVLCLISASKQSINGLFLTPKFLVRNIQDQNDAKRQSNFLKKKYNKVRKKFSSQYGDHISLLNVWEKYNEMIKKHDNHEYQSKWCYERFLKEDTLKKAYKMFRMYKRMYIENSNTINMKDDIQKMSLKERVLASFVGGYSSFMAKVDKDGLYKLQINNKERVSVSDDSFVKKNAKRILYRELFILNKNPELNIVSSIPDKIYFGVYS